MDIIIIYAWLTLLMNFTGVALIISTLDIIYRDAIVTKRERSVLRGCAVFLGILFILFHVVFAFIMAGG